ncbi:50S ribosomal protein L11 methyltransferase [Aurantiacibacter gangjinensis]|uniref:Ribosomal protein L11 methyltransferase n=1 Tax=Aurantiacibacter gangjinensis TaxID=502682 RepID=A0A0G9MPS5_9SPHN|nr:50S ribosomal protein L11 methyltransferase [Aurantiacibacter gangjinensis]APE28526.1 Ribosomal protein L11 methyltransferase [Aurantiacibacter gangjinensis]KLE32727.1 ribonucleotide-diphosphate reductase subunit beta [Aurantiacibacter gangjinensis]
MSWKLSATAPKAAVEAALDRRDEDPLWDDDIVLTGFELDPDTPELWRLDAYLSAKPTRQQREAVLALFDGHAPKLESAKLPDTDWVTESQRGVEPIRAGRFHVHTPDHPPSEEPGTVNFCIPAAQAFGTGHHETTAGCLVMLDAMHAVGLRPRSFADIGTGTGLLAFGALSLWPLAYAVASDIDPVCGPAVLGNCALNDVPVGTDRGELAMLIADGMDDGALQARAPYDLLIANILAGPLIEMAPDFTAAVAPRGSILLAGLLERQQEGVVAAYRKNGFRLHRRIVNGDWSILWLRDRFRG